MSVNIVQLYGPGLSFYLAHGKPSARMNAPVGSSGMSLRDVAVSSVMRSKRSIGTLDESNTDILTSNVCQKYSATLKALHASNELLEGKARKLSNNTVLLELDVMRVQRHIKAFHGELLMTWQADILTRLIEVVYERSGWKMPGGITSSSHAGMDEAKVTLMYRTAARKIKKETLRRRFNLSVQYYLALQRYDEVVCFRSTNPFRSERTFARWLMSQKENHARTGLFNFWARLFPLCYGRTVDETTEMF